MGDCNHQTPDSTPSRGNREDLTFPHAHRTLVALLPVGNKAGLFQRHNSEMIAKNSEEVGRSGIEAGVRRTAVSRIEGIEARSRRKDDRDVTLRDANHAMVRRDSTLENGLASSAACCCVCVCVCAREGEGGWQDSSGKSARVYVKTVKHVYAWGRLSSQFFKPW